MLISAIHRFSTILWKQLSAFLLFLFFCISVYFCIVLYFISNYVFHTHLHFLYIDVSSWPWTLFFFPYSLVWGRTWGWQAQGPSPPLGSRLLRSTLILAPIHEDAPFRTLLHWVSACLMPSVRKREYNAMVMYNNGYYRKYTFFSISFYFLHWIEEFLDFCHTDAFLYLSL